MDPKKMHLQKKIEREMSQIRTQILKLKTQGRVILTGDFNAKIYINQENCNQQTSRNGKHLEKLITDTEMIPITLETTRGIWTRQNRQKPDEKSVIDYILTDKDTHNQMEETIIDEEGTHRIRGTNDSDHNTILTTLNINIIHKPEKKDNLEKRNPGTMDTLQQYTKGDRKQKRPNKLQ